MSSNNVKQIVADWQARGEDLLVPGLSSRIWREGPADGEIVVCIHGVPASGFLYRKVLPALAEQGYQAVTFDLPGMGFAERVEDFDYSWSGLSEWIVKALDTAGIDHFHLVVHDIGGPIGFDVVHRISQRVKSLTVLNTMMYVASFKRPWFMEPFHYPGAGELWLQGLFTPMILVLMRGAGMLDGPSNDELRAYGALLAQGDRGKAFLKVMRGFERTSEFEGRIVAALKARTFPAQVIWGAQDPALRMAQYAPDVCEVLGLEDWHQVRGKHFVQEDSPREIAALVAALAKTAKAA
jgi:pimeloyl-ACP methyl ester carboxylesterase